MPKRLQNGRIGVQITQRGGQLLNGLRKVLVLRHISGQHFHIPDRRCFVEAHVAAPGACSETEVRLSGNGLQWV